MGLPLYPIVRNELAIFCAEPLGMRERSRWVGRPDGVRVMCVARADHAVTDPVGAGVQVVATSCVVLEACRQDSREAGVQIGQWGEP